MNHHQLISHRKPERKNIIITRKPRKLTPPHIARRSMVEDSIVFARSPICLTADPLISRADTDSLWQMYGRLNINDSDAHVKNSKYPLNQEGETSFYEHRNCVTGYDSSSDEETFEEPVTSNLWVPAFQHPEISPKNFKEFLEKRKVLIDENNFEDTKPSTKIALQRRSRVRNRTKGLEQILRQRKAKNKNIQQDQQAKIEMKSGNENDIKAPALMGNQLQDFPKRPTRFEENESSSQSITKKSRAKGPRDSFQDITQSILNPEVHKGLYSSITKPWKSPGTMFLSMIGFQRKPETKKNKLNEEVYCSNTMPTHLRKMIHQTSVTKLTKTGRALSQQVLINNMVSEIMEFEQRRPEDIAAFKKRSSKQMEKPQGSKLKRSAVKKALISGKQSPASQDYDSSLALLKMHHQKSIVNRNYQSTDSMSVADDDDDDDVILERRRRSKDDIDEDQDESVDIKTETSRHSMQYSNNRMTNTKSLNNSSFENVSKLEEDDEKPLGLILGET